MKKNLVIKAKNDTAQLPSEEDLLSSVDGKIIEPYVSFDTLRALYSANVYHKRSLRLKAHLLSQVEKTNLGEHLPAGMTIERFLFKFALNLETFGTAFFERAGTKSNYLLYPLGTHRARIDKDYQIYQKADLGAKYIPLDGAYFLYDTILSDYYGEPDYLETAVQILSTYRADARNGAFFENGARFDHAIIFEDSDPSDEQLQAIQEYMQTTTRGYRNAHKTLILTTGESSGENKPKIRIEDMGKIDDMSFNNLKENARNEIIASHGVPPRLVGVTDTNALGGSGELVAQLEMFNQLTVLPRMNMITAFFAEQGIEIEFRPFDSTSFKDDADLVTGLVQTGIITSAEAKNILGWK